MLHNIFSFAFLASLVVAAPLSSPAGVSPTNPPIEKAIELWKSLPKTPTTPPLSKVIKLLEEANQPVEKRQTTNPGAYVFQELVEGKCAAVTIIFARGTNSDGNVGTLGPYLFNETAKILGASNIVRQGVDYSATIIGYLQGGAPDGGPEMARLTRLARTQCPKTQVVLAGYSQGAQIVHNTLLSAADIAVVKAVVLFGDPDEGDMLQNISSSMVKTFCHSDDVICDGVPITLPSHFTYNEDADDAAKFIATKVTIPKRR